MRGSTPHENKDIPALRGHHLVCLQFFYGDGYPRDYIANLLRVNDAFSTVGSRVIEGADDVCTACPSLSPDGTCAREPSSETTVRKLDELALEVLGVGVGELITRDGARRRLYPSLDRWRGEACTGCEWANACRPSMKLMYGEQERVAN